MSCIAVIMQLQQDVRWYRELKIIKLMKLVIKHNEMNGSYIE